MLVRRAGLLRTVHRTTPQRPHNNRRSSPLAHALRSFSETPEPQPPAIEVQHIELAAWKRTFGGGPYPEGVEEELLNQIAAGDGTKYFDAEKDAKRR